MNIDSKNGTLKKIGTTTVWNFHDIKLTKLGYNKKSNLSKKLRDLHKLGIKGKVTVFIEAIGRSGHSASRIGIYKGVTDSDYFSMYYSTRHCEFFLNDLFK